MAHKSVNKEVIVIGRLHTTPNEQDTFVKHVSCKCLDGSEFDVCVSRMMPWKTLVPDTFEVLRYFINFDYKPDPCSLEELISRSVEVDEDEYKRLTEVLHDFEDHPEKYIKEKKCLVKLIVNAKCVDAKLNQVKNSVLLVKLGKMLVIVRCFTIWMMYLRRR